MLDQSSKHPDQHNNDDEILSSLTINIDKDGNLNYDVDWIPDKQGQKSIAAILYMLIAEDFGSHIVKNLKATLGEGDEGTKKNIDSVEKILMELLMAGDNNDVDKSSVVVPPDVIIDI